MTKYEFKKIDVKPKEVNMKDEINEREIPREPNKSQISMIASSLEKDLIEKLLKKSEDLEKSLNGIKAQFQDLQKVSLEREKQAFENGVKEGESRINLNLKNEIENERNKIIGSINKLDSTIENSKKEINKLELELSAIALDIAREVIIKEISSQSAKIAESIAKELLASLGENLNVVLKVNPSDFAHLSEVFSDKMHVKIQIDDAIARGGIVILSENGNIDGGVMSRYKLLKQSVLDNFRD